MDAWIYFFHAAGGGSGFGLIDLFLVLALAWLSGELVNRLNFPRVLGELAAGIVFGPPILGWIHPSAGLEALAEVGVFLLMLYIGMEMDFKEILREIKPGFMASMGGIIFPFGAGLLLGHLFGLTIKESLIIATLFAETSMATKSRILIDLNIIGTRLASILIASTLLTDTIAFLILALVYKLIQTGSFALSSLGWTGVQLFGFLLTALVIGHYGLPLLSKFMEMFGFRGRTVHFTLLLLIALLYAYLAELAGLHAILGAFFAGLFLKEGMMRRKLSHEIQEMVHDLSVGFLAPVFFVTVGFDLDLQSVLQGFPFVLLLVFTAMVTKIGGTALFYSLGGNGNWREGLVLGTGLNGRGVVGIIVAQIGLEMGALDTYTFSALVLTSVLTTLSVPILLNQGVRWLRKRGELVPARRRGGVIIVGAHPLARHLALAYDRTEQNRVVLVDSNPENCEESRQAGLSCLTGNAFKEEILEEAGAKDAQSIIVITPNTETNLLIGRFARETFLIPEAYVLVEAEYRDTLWNSAKEDGLIPINFGAFTLTEWNRWITEGRVQMNEVGVTGNIRPDLFLETVYQHDVVLPLTVVRNGTPIFFYALQDLRAGDRVRVLNLVEPAFSAQDDLDFLIEKAPVVDLEDNTDQDKVFELLAEIFGEQLNWPKRDLYDRFWARERELSTWVAPGLAIPHIVIPGNRKVALVIGRSEQGIPWGSPDRKVHAIFAFVSTLDYRLLHLRLLASIAQIAHHPEFMDRFLEAKNPQELRQFLLSVPRRRFARRYLQS